MRNPEKHFYDFGPFRFDPDRHRLFRDGNPVSLPPKAIDALLVLVQNKGKLLERETLMEAVWADSFVEDANLTVAISNLRKALGQNGETAQYIETIPRVGYRFVADVREVQETPAPLIIEKHTRSQTVIEEEFLEDAPARLEKVVSQPGRSAAVSLSLVFRQHTAAAFLAIVTLVGAGLGAVVYLKPGGRETVAANNIRMRSIRSLAVLPPKVLGVAGDDPSLSLGMADALITKLAGLHKLKLSPTSSISRYLTANNDSVTVGHTLGVDAVLEGALQHEGGRLRLTLQLIDVASATAIWTGKFDEVDADIFKLQDSVSQQMADVLSLSLTQNEKTELAKRPTQNSEAYGLYLKGNYFWNKRGNEVLKSIDYFRKAIDLDPNFVQAYVGLAKVTATSLSRSGEAQMLVEKALQLDDTCAEAHATLGFIHMFHHWDWASAGQELDRAIELDPDSSVAHHWKGVYLSLLGRLDEAKMEMHRALELDPLSLIITADIGQLHYFAREYDQAIDYCNRALALDNEFWIAHVYLTYIYRMKGMEQQTFDEILRSRKLNANSDEAKRLSGIFARSGLKGIDKDYLQRSLRTDIENGMRPIGVTQLYLNVDDKEQALRWLSRASEEREFLLPFINVDPFYDPLRGDPRFKEIVQHMSLTPHS
ncbi:MAG: winged helix-turn-helix domain-containing protein [Acidobacteriota bacterium]|nr:winged helix-turn-helix domain-containing protein [Acidobacteriota bacterium]